MTPWPSRIVSAGRRDLRVLVVDDDAFVRRTMRRILGGLGVGQVDEAIDGHTALARLSDGEPPAVIVCDLRMPGMDGVVFLRHVAETGFDGRIVLMSGEDSRFVNSVAGLVTAHSLKLAGIVEKPVSRSAIEALIAEETEPDAPDAVSEAGPEIDTAALQRTITGGGVRMHYQPKIEVLTGRLVGVEALCRLIDETGALRMPATFISVAERNDLIDVLTMEIVSRTLDTVARWRQRALDVNASINVSIDSLTVEDFPEFLGEQLERRDLDPRCLTVELTESQLLGDKVLPIEVLNRLHLRGITLSIDDFGTGYSSFLQLRRLPFRELKLDRSYVIEVTADPAARAIVQSAVSLAQSLGMRVVAEGVETVPEFEFLRSVGVDVVQGYLVAPPMDEVDFERWHAERIVDGVLAFDVAMASPTR